MRSRTTLSVLARPLRQTLANNSPTVRTRRLPRWSISSIPISNIDPASSRAICSSVLPRFKSVSLRVAATRSSTVVTRTSKGVSNPSLRFNMCLPTFAKSYRLESINNRLINASAFALCGGSPGRNFL